MSLQIQLLLHKLWQYGFGARGDNGLTLKSVQDKLTIKQDHKEIITSFQPTRNSSCYSKTEKKKRDKLYGRFNNSRSGKYLLIPEPEQRVHVVS